MEKKQRHQAKTNCASPVFVSSEIKEPAVGNPVRIIDPQRLEKLDRIFNLTPDMLCMAGADGYLKRLNPACEDLLGFSREELLGRPFLDSIHPDDREATMAEVARQMGGSPTIRFEDRWRCHDGSYKILE